MQVFSATLDAIRGTIVATYKWPSELDDAAIVALMQAETWFDADGAIENGFATEKVEGLSAAASISPASVAKLKVTEKFKARIDALLKKEDPAPVAAAAVDVIAAVAAASLPAELAGELVKAALPMDQVASRVNAAKTERTQREARATEIRALCAMAKQPELADGYVNGAMSAADVRAHLAVITAKQDKVEIDAGLSPDRGAVKSSRLSASRRCSSSRSKARIR